MVLCQFLAFMARVAVEDSTYLTKAVTDAGQQFGQPQLLGAFIDVWMEKVSVEMADRKCPFAKPPLTIFAVFEILV